MTTQITELEQISQDTNESAIAVTDPVKAELIEALGPIASRLEGYEQSAVAMVVKTEQDAQDCADLEAEIQKDIKVVKDNETLTRITDGLHKLHKKWTGFRGTFDKSLTTSKKALRTKRIAWEDEQKAIAAKEQARLQAIADEKARKEREKEEALAQKQRDKEEAARQAEQEALRKALEATNEEERKIAQAEADKAAKQASAAQAKAKLREDKADSVATTQVRVEAPKSSGRRRTAWKVTAFDPAVFFAMLATRKDLQGFVEIKQTNLERAKAANPMMEVKGVTFEQVAS